MQSDKRKMIRFAVVDEVIQSEVVDFIINAVQYLNKKDLESAKRIEILLLGEVPQEIRDKIICFFLYRQIIVKDDYLDLVARNNETEECDWIITMNMSESLIAKGKGIVFVDEHFTLCKLYQTAEKQWQKNIRSYQDFGDLLQEIVLDTPTDIIQKASQTVLAPQNRDWQQDKVLTVCVPSYNVERYLDRCITTLTDLRDITRVEILIVNDGSKDQTPEIGAEFEKHYPGIVRVINKENGGHGSTINTALAQAKGKYFMVVDGDDWVDSRSLSDLLDEVKERRLDTDVLCTNYHEVDMGSGKATPWLQSEKPRYGVEQRFDELDVKNVYFTLANSMFKTDVLRKSGMKLQEHTFYVDVEYILFPIPFVQSAIFFDLYIYKYCRGNAEQSVHIPNMVNRYDHHERVMKRVLAYYSTQQMQEKQRAYMKEILCKLLFTHYSLFMVYDKDKQRGYARGKDFDSFLKQTNKELYQWIGHEMPMVKVARRCGFDYRKAEKSLSMKLVKVRAKSRSKIKSAFLKVIHSRIVCKLMNNRLVRAITHSDKVKGNPVFQKVKKRIASMQE